MSKKKKFDKKLRKLCKHYGIKNYFIISEDGAIWDINKHIPIIEDVVDYYNFIDSIKRK